MNEFIRLRKDYLRQTADHLFSLAYAEKFEMSRKANPKEQLIMNQLKTIFQLQQKKKLNRHDMLNLLSYLGTNDYVEGYIVALFKNNKQLFRDAEISNQVMRQILDKNEENSTIYALLDSCIECENHLFNQEILHTLLEKDSLSLDTFSMIVDYIHHFKIAGFQEEIISWLAEDYPVAIKIQLIDLFIDLYSIKNREPKLFFSKEDQKVMENYIKNIKKDNRYATDGYTVLQSMFYGDFKNSGKGNNGGLAIFLKNLGKELSRSEEIGKVVTLAITNEWSASQSLITEYSNGHLFVNIPIYVDKSNPTEFLKKENLIKRTIHRFLERLGLKPDIYHVRFLDNASKAMAQLSEEQDKKLVVTLAPDPHRNMTNQTGRFKSFSFNELLEKLNKILIGDELISTSDKIVGIGSRVVEEELEQYFPRLSLKENRHKVQMISEGIQTNVSLIKQERKAFTDKEFEKMGLTKRFLEKPIILNVGRLNKLKAQDQLLKGWLNSELSTTYNLLIVGGDLENPNTEEQEIMNLFDNLLDENQQQKDHFLHLGAFSNYQIRKIEQRIRAVQKDYPQIYLCSSQKEEFGIAILEALSERFLVLAPKKGGAKSYIEDGVNGFLIDTTDWKSIAEATEVIIESLKYKKENFENIQEAGEKTVQNNFSMAIIAEDFLSLYLSLQEKE